MSKLSKWLLEDINIENLANDVASKPILSEAEDEYGNASYNNYHNYTDYSKYAEYVEYTEYSEYSVYSVYSDYSNYSNYSNGTVQYNLFCQKYDKRGTQLSSEVKKRSTLWNRTDAEAAYPALPAPDGYTYYSTYYWPGETPGSGDSIDHYYSKNYYTLTITHTRYDEDGQTVIGTETTTHSVANGSTVTVTDYALTYTGFSVYGSYPTSIEMDDDKTASIFYIKNPSTCTLTLSVSPAGSGVCVGAGTYSYGTTASFYAVPSGSYSFVQWSDGDTSSSRSVVMDSNKSFTAYFTIYYTLTITHKYYNAYGTLIETATTTERLASGTVVNVVQKARDKTGFGNPSASPASVTMDGNKSATIIYSQVWPEVIVSATWEYGHITVNGTTYTSDYKAYLAPGTVLYLVAIPNNDSIFEYWNTEPYYSESVTYTVPSQVRQYTPIAYMRYPRITCTTSPENSGTVQPTESEVPKGSYVTVTATSTQLWQFSRWSDGGTASHQVLVDSDKNLIAYFNLKHWVWTNLIAPGEPVSNLTATDWNNFTSLINRVRELNSLPAYTFTPVSSQNTLTANIFNEAVLAITDLPNHGTIVDTKGRGDDVMAAYFDGDSTVSDSSIKAALNRAIDNT